MRTGPGKEELGLIRNTEKVPEAATNAAVTSPRRLRQLGGSKNAIAAVIRHAQNRQITRQVTLATIRSSTTISAIVELASNITSRNRIHFLRSCFAEEWPSGSFPNSSRILQNSRSAPEPGLRLVCSSFRRFRSLLLMWTRLVEGSYQTFTLSFTWLPRTEASPHDVILRRVRPRQNSSEKHLQRQRPGSGASTPLFQATDRGTRLLAQCHMRALWL